MLILEGPDGGGKTTLVKRLSSELNLPVHERACTSDGGPVDDLFKWAYRDAVSMPDQPMAIYDRHPLISEYIYGPIARHYLLPEFRSPKAHALMRLMAAQVHVVFCIPPLEAVVANLSRETSTQMPGVVENIARIHAMYQTLAMFWPGESTTYDYTAASHSYEHTLVAARLHVVHTEIKKERSVA